MSIEAMKQALEALELALPDLHGYWKEKADAAIASLRQAIEQAEKQEPVDWKRLYELEKKKKEAIYEKYERDIAKLPRIIPMEATSQREWVGLTREEILNLGAGIVDFEYAAAIEAKLKEKNT